MIFEPLQQSETSVAKANPEFSKPSLQDSGPIDVSLVVPLWNEEETIVELEAQIRAALASYRYELIFVDDGSSDASWQRIEQLSKQSPQSVKGIRHRRNFGKAAALSSGFAQARGGKIVTLDADLQDDPKEIVSLLSKLDVGYDLVSGWKRDRQDPLSKTLPSRVFNWASRRVSGLELHDFNCGIKAYRRVVAKNLKLYGELHRFIPILAHAEGFRVAEMPVTHHPRTHGKSKYGWKRLLKGALDLFTVALLTRYLRRPGHFFGGIGLVIGGGGLAILGYLSVMKLGFGQDIGARPLFFLGILAALFGGQLISVGTIGEFLLRHQVDNEDANRSRTIETTDGK